VKAPQRKARLFRVVDLASLRNSRGLSLRGLADLMIPPVRPSFISALEKGQSLASPATLFDLARIFGSIEIEDELGHRYTLVHRGQLPPPLAPEIDWP
jgi:transcriptional regulator with XRE-family HTH domain